MNTHKKTKNKKTRILSQMASKEKEYHWQVSQWMGGFRSNFITNFFPSERELECLTDTDSQFAISKESNYYYKKSSRCSYYKQEIILMKHVIEFYAINIYIEHFKTLSIQYQTDLNGNVVYIRIQLNSINQIHNNIEKFTNGAIKK